MNTLSEQALVILSFYLDSFPTGPSFSEDGVMPLDQLDTTTESEIKAFLRASIRIFYRDIAIFRFSPFTLMGILLTLGFMGRIEGLLLLAIWASIALYTLFATGVIRLLSRRRVEYTALLETLDSMKRSKNQSCL